MMNFSIRRRSFGFSMAVVALPFLALPFARPMSVVAAPSITPISEASRASQKTDEFVVGGDVEKPGVWTVERIKKEMSGEIKTVNYTLKDKKHTAQCVPLLSLVNLASPRVDPKRKHHMLSFVVVARAVDGYTIPFSQGELSPEYGKRTVWLALDRDGQPFTKDEAPINLLAVDDEKPSRWVHGVRRIVLIDTSREAAVAGSL